MQLKNKTAIVTGGGTGIGRGIAPVLSSRGANIVICGRTESRLQETQLQLRKEGSRVESYVCDVTDRRSVETFVYGDSQNMPFLIAIILVVVVIACFSWSCFFPPPLVNTTWSCNSYVQFPQPKGL